MHTQTTEMIESEPTVQLKFQIMKKINSMRSLWYGGDIATNSLSNFHIVPNQTPISAEYYHWIILEEYLLPVLFRTRATGKFDERKLVNSMSE